MASYAIKAAALAVPDRVVTNQDLAQIMDTSDAWIRRRTGIKQRHIATQETNASLCLQVARQLVSQSEVAVDELDYIIVATMSPDYLTPAVAAEVQGGLGATNAVAFDVNAACSGFVYATQVMNSLLAKLPGGTGIVIGGERLSKLVDWSDRTMAVLFGDGAAGVLVKNDGSPSQVLATDLRTVGRLGSALTAGQLAEQTPFGAGKPATDHRYFAMDGHEVYNFATRQSPASIQRAADQAGVELSAIKYFVMHQANARIVKRVAKQLDLPLERFPINITEYGNTAAASEPLLLAELIAQHKLQRGDYVALTGFGGGLTVGTVIIRY
ncbi:ketoacyl-ACP synthase III [Fructilactobacillus myrtifloralis]|uniref:Beta-ketoacyl-[acyl-carrier-protein] synthase III n=1 Tax=Fructilactobacillus myrtifloralis TaxID=2940301 RepID=A0ABY5BQA6_9LACO|nr:beta-ketoacyl-ACP synthase III [Fructilactobacillus myrtifloralis]USS84776.1 ketoacyl-ACP synthase III [Fructilactobacillus myrtifloralis]